MTDTQTDKKQPTNKVRFGNVQVTEWENTSKDDNVFNTYTIGVSYKDEKGQWQDGKSYSMSDLMKLRTAVDKMLQNKLTDK